MEFNLENQFDSTETLTVTGFLANCIDTTTTLTHPENELDPIGVTIPFSAVTVNGTQTYQFQVINDSASNGTTTPQVVADTGSMAVTDNRLLKKSKIWLEIDWNLVQQRYLMVKFTGANSPSMTIGGCWLARRSEISEAMVYPNNYAV